MIILVINCGSSSIKYRLFDMRDQRQLAAGLMDRIDNDYESGVAKILDRLISDKGPVEINNLTAIQGVGHRVVHGGDRFDHSLRIDESVREGIAALADLAPLHNPANLAGIDAAMRHLESIPHVAVFDTAFFQTLPPYAYTYAVPRQWQQLYGIRRYGFHGTSHRYVTQTAAELFDNDKPNLITLHLGNGCSATCVRDGKAIDHSMGLTPLEGLVMGTRSGDIDPTVVFHLLAHGMSIDDIRRGLEKQGGLLGVSGVSHDMRDVLSAAEQGNDRAQLAVDLFVHRVRKYLGAYLLQLPDCDAIVFTGGIGEHASTLRAAILKNLDPFGIHLDADRNESTDGQSAAVTTDDSRIAAWVIPTNEELLIARDTRAIVG